MRQGQGGKEYKKVLIRCNEKTVKTLPPLPGPGARAGAGPPLPLAVGPVRGPRAVCAGHPRGLGQCGRQKLPLYSFAFEFF